MKKTLLLIVLALSTLATNARDIDYETAKQLAEKILGTGSATPVTVVDALSLNQAKRRELQAQAPSYYIFNNASGKGFVIISAEDALGTVLGYSTESSFDSDDDMPDGLKAYLANCESAVSQIRAGASDIQRNYAPKKLPTTVVAPLIRAVWGQEQPYNNMVPKGYLAGCVAIAMAQIMHKWQWPVTGTGKISYINTGGYVSVNLAESNYDWANIQAAGNSSQASANAVSKLCYDCGIAVKMDYTENVSGAYMFLVASAFVKNFRYAASKIQFYFRNAYTEEVWNEKVKNELDAGRPILFSANEAHGDGAHAYVVDGYDSDFNVHINWGWNGSYNGYFDLNIQRITNSYQFSKNQNMICGIEPDYDGTDNQYRQLPVYLFAAPVVETKQVGATDSFTISVNSYIANSTPAKGINVKIALCDAFGNYIQGIDSLISHPDFMVATANDLDGYDFKVLMPKDIADGNYAIRLYFQERSAKYWILPQVNGGNDKNHIYVRKENGKLYFNEIPTAIVHVEKKMKGTPKSIYNLSGQRLGNLNRGLNIVDGKKIWVR